MYLPSGGSYKDDLPRKMEPIEGSETSAFKPQTPGKNKSLFFLHLPRKMEPIEGSETSTFKPQTPGNTQKKTSYIKNTAKA